jgi:hypothetical protein
MSREQLKDTLEAIGFIALIASLIFVGLQIRQDHVIALAQDAADFDDTMIEYASVINANREVWVNGLNGAELSILDQVTFETVAFTVWQKFGGIYRRTELLEDRNTMGVARQVASELFVYPGLRQYFMSRCAHRESMGQQISFCDDIRTQLSRLDDGSLPPPEGRLYVL